MLTPISLPDSAYTHTRTSPAVSHHSQEYTYPLDASVPPHGLGITVPFPTDFPQAIAPGMSYVPDGMKYMDDESMPARPVPQHRSSRPRRANKPPPPPVRGTPVSILPHPEGLQRLEEERRQSHGSNTQMQGSGRAGRDQLAEDEGEFVERLREEGLSWKIITQMYRERFNKDTTEARLQMRRFRRRKEMAARWDENDVSMCV